MNEFIYTAIVLAIGAIIGCLLGREHALGTITARLTKEWSQLTAVQSSGPAPRLDRCAWFERRGKLLGLGLALAIVRGGK
jgi:hypothetical protein